MKKISIAIILLSFCLLPFHAFANQVLIGAGLTTESGEDKYDTERLPIMIAFETKTLWRFSFTDTAFEHETNTKSKIKGQILGAERMWVHKINDGFALIGGFGPGYFSIKTEEPDGSDTAFGIMATGTARFSIGSKIFIEAALHYRNVAVSIKDSSFNGGYQGMLIGLGYFF